MNDFIAGLLLFAVMFLSGCNLDDLLGDPDCADSELVQTGYVERTYMDGTVYLEPTYSCR